jgi:hypothetical protein
MLLGQPYGRFDNSATAKEQFLPRRTIFPYPEASTIIQNFGIHQTRYTHSHPMLLKSSKTALFKYQTCTLKLNIQAKGRFISRMLCVSGDRKYGVPNLDPFFLKEMSAKEFGIVFNVSDMIVEGVKDATLQDVK